MSETQTEAPVAPEPVKPGVSEQQVAVFDEPESSPSAGTNMFFAGQVPEDAEPPSDDELREAEETVQKATLLRNTAVATPSPPRVSYAPQVFGAAPESPVIYGEEDDADFLPGYVPEDAEADSAETESDVESTPVEEPPPVEESPNSGNPFA